MVGNDDDGWLDAPLGLLIALDYDGTYTACPEIWLKVIAMFRAGGHRVMVVTMRTELEGAASKTSR